MAIQFKTKHLITGAILTLLLTLGIGWWLGYSRQKKMAETTSLALKNEIQRLIVEINDKEYSLTKVEQELATEKELRKQDIIDKETLRALNIKHVKELTKLKLRIDTLLKDMEHNGQIISILDSQIKNKDTIKDKVSYNAIRLPFSFTKKDTWLDLNGNFDSQGVLDISLKMDMSVDAISGIDKTTKKPILSLLTDNKYVQTIGIRSYKTDTPKPQRYGIGLQGGYGLIMDDNPYFSPYLGIGVHYSLIKF